MDFPVVHILRHGESLHNVHGPGYPDVDPPLTAVGVEAAKKVGLGIQEHIKPDIILISPLARTIQTALSAFPQMASPNPPFKIEIFPDLRETGDSPCNKGVGSAALTAGFSMLPSALFSHLPATWDYPLYNVPSALERAERVRQHIFQLGQQGYKNIVLVSHRLFLSLLVQGPRFQHSELRSFQFVANPTVKQRMGPHCETGVVQDFGPTVLVTQSQKPILLLLNGYPGVGKFTIGKALKKSLSDTSKNALLIDNHSVIDIVIKTETKHTPGYYSSRKSVLRSEFFDKIVETDEVVVIMTSVFAEDINGIDQWKDHVALCRERGFRLVQINLGCEADVNAERLVSEERLNWVKTGEKMKQILPARLAQLRAMQVMIDPKNHVEDTKGVSVQLFEIDVSKLSVDQSVEKLRTVLKTCRESLEFN